MSTLADPQIRAACCERLAQLQPATQRKWGRMTAHQMVCHLNDSFEVAMGDRYASPDTNLFKQTVFKWAALHMPFPWPHGVATRPEIEQGRGGTTPVDWQRDTARLRQLIPAFAGHKTFGAHPIFGAMSQRDWLTWGYRHVDHHLRQFGV